MAVDSYVTGKQGQPPLFARIVRDQLLPYDKSKQYTTDELVKAVEDVQNMSRGKKAAVVAKLVRGGSNGSTWLAPLPSFLTPRLLTRPPPQDEALELYLKKKTPASTKRRNENVEEEAAEGQEHEGEEGKEEEGKEGKEEEGKEEVRRCPLCLPLHCAVPAVPTATPPPLPTGGALCQEAEEGPCSQEEGCR